MIRERDDLQTIPGIGPNMAGHLHRLGIRRVADLLGQSPEALYERDRELAGRPVGRGADSARRKRRKQHRCGARR